MSRLFALGCGLALAAVPATAVSNIRQRVPDATDGIEQDAPAKARNLDVPATQINRCPDGRGGLRLQDRPCAPLETRDAGAAATANAAEGQGDVVDLSALPPRSARSDDSAPTSATAESEKPSMLRSLRDGALKLVAFVAALYVSWRLARSLLARRRRRSPESEPPPASRAYGRPAPRPRAVIRRPERRRGSRWRRSS